jgi:ubiquinol-cytochrome c reductase cytochrome b subunit
MSTSEERVAARKRQDLEKRAFDEIDDRLGTSSWLKNALNHIFPDHWSFMVGEIAMYCLVILIITGVYLTFFFHASNAIVTYHGPYHPLDGQQMTEAYSSVLNISFHVRAGLVMRQIHHWAALIFLAAVFFHLGRIFFTGAFRKPREINWIIGLTLLISVMLEGFTGYSLPDDLLSGTGVRAALFSLTQGIPFVGTWVTNALFGGPFPGNDIIPRLFVIHEFLFPALIVGLLSAHLAIIWRQGHTDFPGPGKTERNITGSRVWPQYTLKSTALFMVCFAVCGLLGGLIEINPVWIYGPYQPFSVSAGSQPDWYVGWLDGALRLWPHWEFRSFGHEISNPVFPGLVMPGIVFTLMYAWPAIDRRIYRDHDFHNLLDRPRDKAFRTAVGAGAVVFFVVLTLASATDLLANDFHAPFERLIEILQYASFVGPIVTGVIAYKVCKSLQRTGAHPIKRPSAGIIVRSASGGYHMVGEVHGDGEEPSGDGHGGNGERHAVRGDGGEEEELEEPVVTSPGSGVGSGSPGAGAGETGAGGGASASGPSASGPSLDEER